MILIYSTWYFLVRYNVQYICHDGLLPNLCLFVAHPERYHYLVILGEMPPKELSLATRSAKYIVDPIDEKDIIGSAIAVDEVIDQGEKIDGERSETEEGGTDGVSFTVVERKDEEDTSTTIDDTTLDDN